MKPARAFDRAARLLFCGAWVISVTLAQADWFVSSEVKALMVKAEAGDALAQFEVATAYDYGRGAPRDGKEAMKWYARPPTKAWPRRKTALAVASRQRSVMPRL